MKTKILFIICLIIMVITSIANSNFESKTTPFLQTIPNPVTATYKVEGNCDMCKNTIETAANKRKIVKANWNVKSKILTVTYDSTKTNSDEILKRIAYAGYDNEKFFAPDAAYSKLPDCCQYTRSKKSMEVMENISQPQNGDTLKNTAKAQQDQNLLEPVYALYFSVKDALVKDDGTLASGKAKDLTQAIEAVKMEALSADQHKAFMKYLADLKLDASHIGETKEIEHQRDHFSSLSKNMFELMKKIKPAYSVYLEHCPMYNSGKGANWISKENLIKNPYYGSAMPVCGKVIETLK